jgi:hypothetical protein
MLKPFTSRNCLCVSSGRAKASTNRQIGDRINSAPKSPKPIDRGNGDEKHHAGNAGDYRCSDGGIMHISTGVAGTETGTFGAGSGVTAASTGYAPCRSGCAELARTRRTGRTWRARSSAQSRSAGHCAQSSG